jgi:hypothetical protein
MRGILVGNTGGRLWGMLRQSRQPAGRAAISPRAAQGFAESLDLAGRPRRLRAWLASTAFTGVFIAAMASNPQSALAACAVTPSPNTVTCDNTNQATAGTLNTSFAGTTVVNVNDRGRIDSGGATATVTAAGNLTFNNNDTTFGITSAAGNGVNLANDFGAITYVGNANVTAAHVGGKRQHE